MDGWWWAGISFIPQGGGQVLIMGTITITDGPGKKAINQMIKDSDLVSKVGFFESAIYPDGTDIAYVASIQEYGVPSRSIPARPFMRPTMDEEANTWKKIVEDGCRLASEGKMTIYGVMERVGLQAAGDCKAKISTIYDPPLSDITMMARKYKSVHGPDSITGGKMIGEFAAQLQDMKDKGVSPDFSGISNKPLNDTHALITHLVHKTGKD